MKQMLFLIYNKIENIYSKPLVFINKIAAERYFNQLIQRPKDLEYQGEPTDYELYFIGSFDPELGEVVLVSKEFIVKGQPLTQEQLDKGARENE